MTAPDIDALFIPILTPDERSDELRDDLAHARRDRDLYRLMFRAAMDQLSLVATAPERAEQIQRELRKEREGLMATAMGEDAQ